MRRTSVTQGLESPPGGAESKPRRAHRATGKPRGGARPGAGRKGMGKTIRTIAARGAGASLRTMERVVRVVRYSPTLEKDIRTGSVSAAVAERIILNVIRLTFLQKEIPKDWLADPQTKRVIREIQVAYRKERDK